MLFLVVDIIPDYLAFGLPNGKRTIPSLPCEVVQRRISLLDPCRGSTFEVAYQICNRHCLRDYDEQMDMVGNASYAKRTSS